MIIEKLTLDEERALYDIHFAEIRDCRFCGPADGESALKESSDIVVSGCYFDLRYPFWHTDRAKITNCELTENCRAALWYDSDITIEDSTMGGIKAFRECRKVSMTGCSINSPEFCWKCDDVTISNCDVTSEYPFFECYNMHIDHLTMHGKYSFQYIENVTISTCDFYTKDAFWHSKNVTVTDSVLRGEYLGWYSENLTLIRCRIIGTQPLCYCKNLVLIDCFMEGTDLAFENSTVTATVQGSIESVKNPISGSITADSIGDIILDSRRQPATECEIVIRNQADAVVTE